MSTETEILDLFKCVVLSSRQKTLDTPYTDLIKYGYVLDFTPTVAQIQFLKNASTKLDFTTFFSVDERLNSDPHDLMVKQVLHYIEVYGFEMPGLFDIELDNGSILTVNYIKGITPSDMTDVVEQKLYTNAPVESAEKIKNIIKKYKVKVDINKVANNELRVLLFDASVDTFADGDDAVRYLVKQATDNTLLIKSRDVIGKMGEYAGNNRSWMTTNTTANMKELKSYLAKHEVPLSKVFKRHKKLIMALKNTKTAHEINRISRLSNKYHVPIQTALNKVLLTNYLSGKTTDFTLLDQISVRDKFKYLNLLAHKKAKADIDAFNIRNGKTFIKAGRTTYDLKLVDQIENAILDSLKSDLSGLQGKAILLDETVDYGLPISAKQTMGRLPYGTKVNVGDGKISSGVYWENSWGVRDLDLSTVDRSGRRVGWGSYSGYADNDVVYSGDVTNAPNGAMEFMTSDSVEYGLFVNIYSGSPGSQCEIVVGTQNVKSKQWIDNVLVREKYTLDSRMSGIGFVKGKSFVVYPGRLNNSSVSSGRQPIIERGLGEWWTISTLLDAVGISYDLVANKDKKYDYDLSYAGMTYNSLERMFD